MTEAIDLGIDDLEDVRVLGSGGFSVVYAARHSLFRRPVAVKVLRKLTKESDRRRFERECEVLGRMSDHPNVVTVYHAGYSRLGDPFLIMELIEGGTLADLLARQGPLPWQQAIELAIPICDALARAHGEQILHRDIKPENILVGSGIPKLTDFGIAYLRDSTGATSTHITASWLHTAPETFDNQRDERSDLYSLASTLYQLITGRAPFWHPDDESLNPLIMRLASAPPPPLDPDRGPPKLNDFFLRALAKNPDERPQTATEFRDRLVGVLPGAPAPPVLGGHALGGPVAGGPVLGGPVSGDPVAPVLGGPMAGGPVPGAPAAPLPGRPVPTGPTYSSPTYSSPTYSSPTPVVPTQSVPTQSVPTHGMGAVPYGQPAPVAGPPPYAMNTVVAQPGLHANTPIPSPRKRGSWLGAAAALGLVAVAAVGLTLWLAFGREDPTGTATQGSASTTASTIGESTTSEPPEETSTSVITTTTTTTQAAAANSSTNLTDSEVIDRLELLASQPDFTTVDEFELQLWYSACAFIGDDHVGPIRYAQGGAGWVYVQRFRDAAAADATLDDIVATEGETCVDLSDATFTVDQTVEADEIVWITNHSDAQASYAGFYYYRSGPFLIGSVGQADLDRAAPIPDPNFDDELLQRVLELFPLGG